MSVFVVGLNGCRLMPTSERKARLLLKHGKASVYRKAPFTIKLNYKTGSTTQSGYLGIDTGSQHIGVSVVREDGTVLHKEEIGLRDSMSKRKLMQSRASSRRGRRHRKTRYRHPKWRPKAKRVYCEIPDRKGRHWKKKEITFTSKRPKGWLPPSLQSKTDHHIRWIKKLQDLLPEGYRLSIELGRFDPARLKDPEIHGELYQKGPQYDYENVRAYVLDRDRYVGRKAENCMYTISCTGVMERPMIHNIWLRCAAIAITQRTINREAFSISGCRSRRNSPED